MSSCQQFTSAAGSYISITQLTASIILRNVMLLCVVIMWRALNALKCLAHSAGNESAGTVVVPWADHFQS